jgi:Na+-transporting methylmalonyl-CoA/oxaloacetate decarboxylase gamma subunit
MLFVFAFLVLLVLAMTALRGLMRRFGEERSVDAQMVAAIAAALRTQRGVQK